MHILHLTPSFAPHLGGVETHVREVSRELIRLGHEVTIITLSHDQKLRAKEVVDDITVLRLPHHSGANKHTLWRAITQLRMQLEQADIVQVHDVWWWLLPVYPTVAHKLFTTFHGWEGQYPVRCAAKLHRWLAAVGSVKTMHVGDWIREFYWDLPDEVTYGGTRIAPPKPFRKKPSGNEWSCVFIGRLSPENDIEKYNELLEALSALGVTYRMTWIGDGPQRVVCEQYGAVTGMLADPERLLADATIVFSSSYLSILNAQAMGASVCALYSNPLKQRYLETFPGAAQMCIGTDVTQMAATLQQLVANSSSMRAAGSRARDFALAQTWQQVAERYLQLWK